MKHTITDKLTGHFGNSGIKTYAKGKIIIFANQTPPGILWLKEGVVEQYDITPEGNKVVVNIFKPPAFFPMSWAINKTPNTYFYAALSEVKAIPADADKTVEFLRANPDVMFDLLSRVYKGTDALLKRLVLATTGISTNRLVFELLIEAYRFGTVTKEGKVLVKVKQANLAARSGLARETVSRQLHKLENENLIALTKHGILINISRLEQKLS